MGPVGTLDPEIEEEWMYWRLVSKDMELLLHQDSISFVDIQKANAVLDMFDDYEKVSNAYQDKKMDESSKQKQAGKRF